MSPLFGGGADAGFCHFLACILLPSSFAKQSPSPMRKNSATGTGFVKPQDSPRLGQSSWLTPRRQVCRISQFLWWTGSTAADSSRPGRTLLSGMPKEMRLPEAWFCTHRGSIALYPSVSLHERKFVSAISAETKSAGAFSCQRERACTAFGRSPLFH